MRLDPGTVQFDEIFEGVGVAKLLSTSPLSLVRLAQNVLRSAPRAAIPIHLVLFGHVLHGNKDKGWGRAKHVVKAQDIVGCEYLASAVQFVDIVFIQITNLVYKRFGDGHLLDLAFFVQRVVVSPHRAYNEPSQNVMAGTHFFVTFLVIIATPLYVFKGRDVQSHGNRGAWKPY